MRKIYSSLLILFAALNLNAQNAATPNPGFENWVTVGLYQDPVSWNTLNASTAIVFTYTCTKATGVDKHTGTAAVKLQTKSIFGIKANGFISTAVPITSPPYGVTGGIPYTGRPDSIVGWYKNTTVGSDTAFIEFNLKDSVSGTLIGYATYNIVSTHQTYVRFSAPVTYYSSATPNLSYWILSSSARVEANRQVNSTLWVDDLDLIFKPVLVRTPNKLKNFVATTSAPSVPKTFTLSGYNLNDSVTITAPAEYQISFSSATGYKAKLKLAKDSANTLAPTTIYVRYKPLTAGIDSGEVKIKSPGATTVKVKVYGSSTSRMEDDSEPSVIITPNPCNDYFEISGAGKEKITVTIYDVLGKQIKQMQFNGESNPNVETAELKKGLYLCRIEMGNRQTVKRFIKN